MSPSTEPAWKQKYYRFDIKKPLKTKPTGYGCENSVAKMPRKSSLFANNEMLFSPSEGKSGGSQAAETAVVAANE